MDERHDSPTSSPCAPGSRDLRSRAKPRRSRGRLAGVDIAVASRRGPISRASRCCASRRSHALQEAAPPFGGLAATPPGAFQAPVRFARADLRSRGPWRGSMGRGAGAAAGGVVTGDIMLNCFSYHLTPGGHDHGKRRAGARLRGHSGRPRQYRTADRRRSRISSPAPIAGRRISSRSCSTRRARPARDVSSIKQALVSGAALPPSLRGRTAKPPASRRGNATRPPISASSPMRPTTPRGRCCRACSSTTRSSSKSCPREPASRAAADRVGEIVVTRAQAATIRCCALRPAISRPEPRRAAH